MIYYSLDNIDRQNADYNLIIGERSNGKTFAVLKRGVENYFNKGEQMGYVRRWREDLTGQNAMETFSGLVAAGVISQITNSTWDDVKYWRGAWYLYSNDREEKDQTPFCYAFSLSLQEHYKSSSYPNITLVAFDEFLSRKGYLPDEFNLFLNLLSTIIRQRDNVKVYMMANTVNKYAPYFKEMGIEDVEHMIQGNVYLYKKESGLRVAVEYCASNPQGKKSDKYFSFSAKTVNMITKGAWEIDEYPKTQVRWTKKDVLFDFYIIFDGHYITGHVIDVNGNPFMFFHKKKEKEIKHEDTDYVYCDYPDYRKNYHSSITKPTDDPGKFIVRLFQIGKAFYADDETGEILRNYILYSVEKDGVRRA